MWCSPAAGVPSQCPAVINHSVKPLLGEKADSLCRYAGKVVLIVNTASACGYTPQYEGLEEIHKRYATKGLVVVGVPANDFGQQEGGSNKDIAKFCKVNYGVSFLMANKLEKPITQDPLFAGLIKASGQAPQWNFHKYLVDRDGKVVSYSSDVEPTSRQLTQAIERALAKN